MYVREDGWLDDSFLPSNQLSLLQRMVGKRLVNIQRLLLVDSVKLYGDGKDFFRKRSGPILIELENLPPICVDDYRYYEQERSLDISLDSQLFSEREEDDEDYRRFTLLDVDYVDDDLHYLINQKIIHIYILIRKQEIHGDQYRALQDGLQINFEGGGSIIICLRLGTLPGFPQICYPNEVRWDAVCYKINVKGGRLPWQYRLRRWFWRAIYYSSNRSS